MDYRYAGFASYLRFDEEITKVAEILGGKLKPEYQKLLDIVHKSEKKILMSSMYLEHLTRPLKIDKPKSMSFQKGLILSLKIG